MSAFKGGWGFERKIGLDHKVSVHHLAGGVELLMFPIQGFCLSPGA